MMPNDWRVNATRYRIDCIGVYEVPLPQLLVGMRLVRQFHAVVYTHPTTEDNQPPDTH